jgi:hypothetical protein
MRRRSRLVVGVVAALLAIPGGAGGAAPPHGARAAGGPDFQVSGGSADEDDLDPAVAWNATNNQYLVVWQDARDAATRGDDIYGQRLSGTGAALGSNFRISGAWATERDWSPAVVWNQTSNEYLVAWQDDRNYAADKGFDIYGQRISAAGVPVGSNFRVTDLLHSGSYAPALAWNQTNNEYLVVWHDGRSYASRFNDIYGQRVSAAGVALGGNFRVSGPSALKDDLNAAVAWNQANNQYLVVWGDARGPAATRGVDIYGQRVWAGGALAGGNFRISGDSAARDDTYPAIAWGQTSGQYLVVWDDWRFSYTRRIEIYGQRVWAGGALAGGNFRISGADATHDESHPAVAWNSTNNRYLVVWYDGRNLLAARGWDIFGQKVAGGGTLVGTNFRICGPNATADEWDPAVAWDQTAGEFLVVWEDERSELTRGLDIFGQRVAG